MKNFFKYVMMIVAVVMSAVVISSCSKDGDDTPGGDDTSSIETKILGEWNIVGDDAIFGAGSLIFKKDGAMIWNFVDTYKPAASEIKSNNTYTIAGNTLLMDININSSGKADASAKGIITFTGNKAVYVYRWNENSGKGWSTKEYTLNLSKK